MQILDYNVVSRLKDHNKTLIKSLDAVVTEDQS